MALLFYESLFSSFFQFAGIWKRKEEHNLAIEESRRVQLDLHSANDEWFPWVRQYILRLFAPFSGDLLTYILSKLKSQIESDSYILQQFSLLKGNGASFENFYQACKLNYKNKEFVKKEK